MAGDAPETKERRGGGGIQVTSDDRIGRTRIYSGREYEKDK